MQDRDMPFFRLAAATLTIVLVLSCGPSPSGRDGSPINFLEPPSLEKQEPGILRVTKDGYDITITQKAAYRVRGSW